MTKCTGEEQHEHYSVQHSQTILHRHPHTMRVGEFNRLHHHPAREHTEGIPIDVVTITQTPY